jgi:hypothetical protein
MMSKNPAIQSVNTDGAAAVMREAEMYTLGRRLTTGRTYDHKKINKLIINQDVDTHNPGEEANKR